MNFKKGLEFGATFSAPITHLLSISQWSCDLLLNNKSYILINFKRKYINGKH